MLVFSSRCMASLVSFAATGMRADLRQKQRWAYRDRRTLLLVLLCAHVLLCLAVCRCVVPGLGIKHVNSCLHDSATSHTPGIDIPTVS